MRTAGTVTMTGQPGAVIENGVRIMFGTPPSAYGCARPALEVRWPLWRRALVAVGFKRFALKIPPSGSIVLPVREARR